MENSLSLSVDPSDATPIEPVSTPDIKTFFLGGIFILMLLAALYTTREIVMPVVLAFLLKLVLQPLQRFFNNLRVPNALGAVGIIILVISSIIILGTVLSSPAASWAERLPASLPKLQQRLGFLSQPVDTAQKFIRRADMLTQGSGQKVVPVAIAGTRFSDKIFAGTQAMLSGVFTTLLILFFLLASGDTFLRRLVEVLPRFKDKRQAVDISQHIERDISVYLLTITVMNAGVGLATGIMMYACHMDDPMLWGAIAFLLNYVPIVGPFLGVVVFFLVGLTDTDTIGAAFLPGLLYLAIHIVEGTIITPLLLAKRFTLNPVLVVLSLIFWYWMWGFLGAILAMPMLAISKIICDRIKPLHALGHFIEA